jgi:cell division protease FtsH
VPASDLNLVKELEARGVDFRGQYESPFFNMLLSWVLPALIVVAIWVFAMRRMSAGGGVMAFGKSRARMYAEKEIEVTFDDVAGQDEAKRNSSKSSHISRIPKNFDLREETTAVPSA